jgi:hypothetical protein
MRLPLLVMGNFLRKARQESIRLWKVVCAIIFKDTLPACGSWPGTPVERRRL